MKRVFLFVLAILSIFSLSGCFLEPAENLYAIPKQPEDIYNLQSAIEAVMPEGATYSPPTAGDNQQAVQLADLDGDGEDEAIAYLKTSGDSPLMICIFAKRDDNYDLVATVEGAGSSFDRVQYVQMDGRAGYELVVGRQVSDQVTQTLNVYALHGDTLIELLTANYAEFITTDLSGNGCRELILLQSDGEQSGIAELYRWQEGQLVRDREARLTTSVSAVKRMITGKMCEDVPAVFVASEYGEGMIVTDIFGFRRGVFCNLTLSDETDTRVETLRDYYVYSCDIDNDGLIELPHVIPLRALGTDETSKNRSVIRWYNLLLDGSEESKCLTFHDYSGGWYLELPDGWDKQLAVSRAKKQGATSGYRFTLVRGAQVRELFQIITVSSESARQAAERNGWQTLAVKGDTTYLCLMGEDAARSGVTFESLQSMFHFIRVDWDTGETE